MQSVVLRSAECFKETARIRLAESQARSFGRRSIGNVIVLNNLPLTITPQTLMMVSRGLCHCALTPSAGQTADQDLVQSVLGQAWRVKYPDVSRGGGVCIYSVCV